MDKRQENKQSMWETVEDVLDTNQEEVSKIPAFAESVGNFKTKAAAARIRLKEAENATKGKARVKEDAGQSLIAALVAVTSALRVYAHKEHKTELEAKVSMSPSDIKGLRDTELKDVAKMVIGLADENAAVLIPHGITAEKLTDLKTRYDAYCAALSDKAGSGATRNSVRESADALIAGVNKILSKEIDDYMEQMAEVTPEFYNAYWAARPIHVLGVRHKPKEAAAKVLEPAK